MGHLRWDAVIPRVFIEDHSDPTRFLRVTVHAESQIVNVSHWQNDECVSAVRVPYDALPVLMELLDEAMRNGPDDS